MRKFIIIAVLFIAFVIWLDELSYVWWLRLNDGAMYSLINTPQPTVGWGGDRNLTTLKTTTNRFYPTR